MKKGRDKSKVNGGFSMLFPIIVVFCILGAVVFSVAHKISVEMSASAIQNLSESLDLIECTIEAILNKEAEFQKMMAHEIALSENPQEYVRTYQENETMVKIALISTGKTEGISNTGEVFSEEGLDFTEGRTVNGLAVSQSYSNYMGTWAYTLKCPVVRENEEIASLYIEYIYDSLDKSLPNGFYNKRAMLYIMDAESERLVLKPKGMGERNAGHLNLEDFFRANDIQEEELKTKVYENVKNGKNIMFHHDIRGKHSLIYMWSVNNGTLYLIGYVPIDAIQQEGNTVNQNIFIVVVVMLVAFFLCCLLYYFNQRQENKLREEQEKEREIHNKQLAEALQAAQIASNSKTMFLSNMSHDIRTPMNAVIGFTTLLAKDAENPEKVRAYTKKIMASGQHLLSLINAILDVSKIESGKVVLSVEEFTLNDLVSSVDAIIRPMASARKQKFHVEVIGIEHEYLTGDETRINQILLNLLSNAVKYTQEGGNIWFRIIGMKQRSSQYEHIRIEVQDDGYGMTPEYLKILFDAFTRAENSTTNKVQGTGLGMAITKSIVELMGGTIDVWSEVGKGTLFRVELELRIPEQQTNRQFWEKNGISRILTVNNDKVVCENIQILMKDTGVVADTVDNAEAALSIIQENNTSGFVYQLIVIDWNIVEVEGIHKVKEIRAHVPEMVPLLFLADCDAEGLDEALLLKNTKVLPKPFFVCAFQQKVLEIKAEQNNIDFEKTMDDNCLEGLHFLAAEDNEINAEILKEILEMEGADCEIVENGQQAVERFERATKSEFDAILMDVQMPVMNGYDATRAIRALSKEDARKIPIIAMTANAFAEDEKEALNAGMSVHLPKPIDVELLKKVINQYVIRKE
ncbi:signal transduction histidine-protein kinase BarA [Lachnospiraceae bacterium]|nr:signal transduction histidine-protein kinase BarA [Lachnospiraceae bacterium]